MADRVTTDRVVTADHRLSQISTASSTNSRRAKAHIGPWQLGRTLGRGSSGRVRLAKHMESGKLAAVKIVPKAHIMDKATTSVPKASESYGIEREVIIMKLIEHPNIMGLYDVWENKGELYLVLEYIEGGELFDYLISRGRLSEREAIHYFRQICYGVDYCHRFNICHRDLKPENLLLDKHRNIKIADFGMAALESNGRLLETSCGSPHYASPEIVSGKTYHGAPSDIWSCGIILFALLSGHLPFDHDNIRQLLLKVQAGKFSMPSSLSVEARDLISRMLVVDPLKRITMPNILRHPLLQKYPPRRVPSENLHHRLPKVDVMQPIDRIDREILRNLLILWHHDTKETIIARLREPEPNAEKTFYSLLLRFRQRHGIANRDSIPRHRSIASIRSIRSSKSVRSVASLNSKSGSMRSLKSVRSNRSGRSLLSSRRTRRSPMKQHAAAAAAAASSAASKPSNAPTTPSKRKSLGLSETPKEKPAALSTPPSRDNADVFAQLLDQVFNNQQSDGLSAATPTNNKDTSKREVRAVSHPVKAMTSSGAPSGFGEPGPTPSRHHLYQSSPEKPSSEATTQGLSMFSPNDARNASPNNWAPASTVPDLIADRKRIASEPIQPYGLGLDFSDRMSNAGSSQQEHNYLLPMIFEEDRFADAIEEEVELKVYKRGGQQPKYSRRLGNKPKKSITGPTTSGDISQLHITNLVAGESFLSYQPSQAAATVAAPMRPAPRAPSGPRAMHERKPVPVYVEEDEAEQSLEAMDTGRSPLATLNPDNLPTAQPSAAGESRAEPTRSKLQQAASQMRPNSASGSENLHVQKRASTRNGTNTRDNKAPLDRKEEKKSWIRRLTPRLSSRKSSENSARATPNPRTIPTNASEQRSNPGAFVDKENVLAKQKDWTSKQETLNSQRRTAASEEPKQNWFLKLLSSSTQVSARTLMSTCQPIELRAIILEVLNEWMPHGLALYNDGSRGESIIVSILRSNSFHLKPARIGIEISPSRSSAATARVVHQKGSRTSFMTFAGEMERRLGENNVLGVDY